MKEEKIKVTISKNGQVKIAVNGVAGPDCLKATEDLEKALGKVVKREHTEEMLQTPEVETVKVGG